MNACRAAFSASSPFVARGVAHSLRASTDMLRPSRTDTALRLRRTIRMTSTQSAPKRTLETRTNQPNAQLRLLYDGECALCMKEIKFLRARSETRGNPIEFVDISDAQYAPERHSGISYETAMGSMHAIRADGQVIRGVPVFRLAYDAVGLGWVYAVTQLPGVGWLVDRAYELWASKRLALTGRPPLAEVVRMREKKTCK